LSGGSSHICLRPGQVSSESYPRVQVDPQRHTSPIWIGEAGITYEVEVALVDGLVEMSRIRKVSYE